MEERNENICRLCLSIIKNENYEILEEIRSEMLETISVKLNPFVRPDSIICCNCAKSLQKCYDFKTICLNNQYSVKTFINVNEPLKVNLEEVKQLFEDGKMHKGQKICRLCLSLNSLYFADVSEDVGDEPIQNMLMRCIPELNLDLTNEPLVCQACLYLLKRQLAFIQHCLELEEKINLFREQKNKSNPDVVDLYDVHLYFERIKGGNASKKNIPTPVNESNPPSETISITTEPNSEIEENTVGAEISESMEMEVEFGNSENVETNREEENTSLQNQNQEESNNVVEEQSWSETDTAKSDKKFSCSQCSYTAKYKSAMKSHYLTHKSLSEITMFQCTICGHETKRHADLKAHMIIHKNPSELKMFKCTICTYESRRKVDLKNHVYTHNKEPFKCQHCSFESKSFQIITKHMVVHKGRQIFRCSQCPYTSKDGKLFEDHSMMHETPSNRRMFNCVSCEFVTHSKVNLKRHFVVHKDIPEDEMITCYICNFKCKTKASLRKHIMVKHNNRLQVVYKCEQCSYETKIERYFKNHLKCHMDLSELQTFSCTVCHFKTRHKINLTNHVLLHNSQAEVHKCEKCNYFTKVPRTLKRHIKRLHLESP